MKGRFDDIVHNHRASFGDGEEHSVPLGQGIHPQSTLVLLQVKLEPREDVSMIHSCCDDATVVARRLMSL